MEIQIHLDETEPPTGRVQLLSSTGGGGDEPVEPLRFSGWLGLLDALYSLLFSDEDAVPG